MLRCRCRSGQLFADARRAASTQYLFQTPPPHRRARPLWGPCESVRRPPSCQASTHQAHCLRVLPTSAAPRVRRPWACSTGRGGRCGGRRRHCEPLCARAGPGAASGRQLAGVRCSGARRAAGDAGHADPVAARRGRAAAAAAAAAELQPGRRRAGELRRAVPAGRRVAAGAAAGAVRLPAPGRLAAAAGAHQPLPGGGGRGAGVGGGGVCRVRARGLHVARAAGRRRLAAGGPAARLLRRAQRSGGARADDRAAGLAEPAQRVRERPLWLVRRQRGGRARRRGRRPAAGLLRALAQHGAAAAGAARLGRRGGGRRRRPAARPRRAAAAAAAGPQGRRGRRRVEEDRGCGAPRAPPPPRCTAGLWARSAACLRCRAGVKRLLLRCTPCPAPGPP